MFVSTNSAFMQFFSRPADSALCAAIGRILDALKESTLSPGATLALIHEYLNRFCHESGHRLVFLGCINAESLQQGFGQAERNIFVILHVIKCITYICDLLAISRQSFTLKNSTAFRQNKNRHCRI